MKTARMTNIDPRRARAVALALSLLLAACGRDETQARPASSTPASSSPEAASASATPQPADAATEMPQAAAASPSAPTSANASTHAPTFDFVFSTRRGEDAKDPRILSWEDSPCGVGPLARVDRMPIDDPVLLPDRVVEFDDGGKERKRWGKPYEAEVLGLEGDRLMFRVHGHAHAYWTDPQGRIGTLAGDAGARPERQAPIVDCPALPSFGESAYLYCSAIVDDAQRTRRLAWEGPCT